MTEQWQELKETIIELRDNDGTGTQQEICKFLANYMEVLEKQMQQPKWIPVSERLPEEHEWIGTKMFGTTISDEIYVTFETLDGQRFARHISFQNGKLSSADEQRMKVWSKGAKPIAWMPLPEPYKEGEADDE